jgi:hypothetical protein
MNIIFTFSLYEVFPLMKFLFIGLLKSFLCKEHYFTFLLRLCTFLLFGYVVFVYLRGHASANGGV